MTVYTPYTQLLNIYSNIINIGDCQAMESLKTLKLTWGQEGDEQSSIVCQHLPY